MDELNDKIKSLSRYRIEYFLQNPRATKEEFTKDIKNRISTLVQVTRQLMTIYSFLLSKFQLRLGSLHR